MCGKRGKSRTRVIEQIHPEISYVSMRPDIFFFTEVSP